MTQTTSRGEVPVTTTERAVYAAARERAATAARLHNDAAELARRSGDYRDLESASTTWLLLNMARQAERDARRAAIKAGVA